MFNNNIKILWDTIIMFIRKHSDGEEGTTGAGAGEGGDGWVEGQGPDSEFTLWEKGKKKSILMG